MLTAHAYCFPCNDYFIYGIRFPSVDASVAYFFIELSEKVVMAATRPGSELVVCQAEAEAMLYHCCLARSIAIVLWMAQALCPSVVLSVFLICQDQQVVSRSGCLL